MKKARLLPKGRKILERLGENLKYARKRRSLTAEMLSERANILDQHCGVSNLERAMYPLNHC